jgi:hypothetical protein
MPTIVRDSLIESTASVFTQNYSGCIQLLIGVDICKGDADILNQILKNAPEHVTVTLVEPGYSTSTRHNGVHSAQDGGALRTILSFLANSRYVAYLDDDNSWHPDHLTHLRKAIRGVEWTCSLRWLVDEDSLKKLAIDRWHSVGIGKSLLEGFEDGFADPNTLMIDKLACASLLHLWSVEVEGGSDLSGADRRFFRSLQKYKSHRPSDKATVYYRIRKNNILRKYLKTNTGD